MYADICLGSPDAYLNLLPLWRDVKCSHRNIPDRPVSVAGQSIELETNLQNKLFQSFIGKFMITVIGLEGNGRV